MLSVENVTFAQGKTSLFSIDRGGGGGVWSWGLALWVSDSFISLYCVITI